MRILALLLLASPAIAQTPPFQPVATISEIMVAITLPYSDALLYIERNPPKDDRDWETLQYQALMLAESGTLDEGRPATRRSRRRRRKSNSREGHSGRARVERADCEFLRHLPRSIPS